MRPEQIYTDWANHYLAKSGHKRLIKDLQTDVADGVLLAEIIQVVGKGYTLFAISSHDAMLLLFLLMSSVDGLDFSCRHRVYTSLKLYRYVY